MPYVVIPHPSLQNFYCVVDSNQLQGYLDADQPLEEAVDNAGMDQLNANDLANHMERIRKLNNDDNFDYWETGKK